MTENELLALLDDIESDRAERKQSAADRDKIRQAICAFANDLPDYREPGVLFIGADDAGEPVGLPITDQLLTELSSIRDDGNIVPFPSLTVQKRVLKGRDVAVVQVEPSDMPPVRFKGRVWVRVGPRRGIANSDEERRLSEKRRFRDLPADIRPVTSASLDELDDMLFRQVYLPASISRDILEENNRSLEHQYLASRFVSPGTPLCPTLLGLLTVGKSPTDWIPGAYIQFLRVDGLELGDPVQIAREIRGPLPSLLMEMEDLFKINIQTAVDFTSGPMEIRHPDYPLVALQQIARNSILHRTYENSHNPVRIYWFRDRVEISNPGGGFGQVTKQNFGQPGANDYRNPNLAGVMKELGYVQRFGFGIALARKEMEKNGNPPPEFLVEDTHVTVVLRRVP